MKKRTQEKVAKIFAFVVILIMVFQVLLPLFTSTGLNSKSTTANVVTQAEDATAKVTANPNAPVAVSTTTSSNEIQIPAPTK